MSRNIKITALVKLLSEIEEGGTIKDISGMRNVKWGIRNLDVETGDDLTYGSQIATNVDTAISIGDAVSSTGYVMIINRSQEEGGVIGPDAEATGSISFLTDDASDPGVLRTGHFELTRDDKVFNLSWNYLGGDLKGELRDKLLAALQAYAELTNSYTISGSGGFDIDIVAQNPGSFYNGELFVSPETPVLGSFTVSANDVAGGSAQSGAGDIVVGFADVVGVDDAKVIAVKPGQIALFKANGDLYVRSVIADMTVRFEYLVIEKEA